MPLPEARRRALEDVEKAEAVWLELCAVRDEKMTERSRAIDAANKAAAAAETASQRLENAKEHLAYTVGQTDG